MTVRYVASTGSNTSPYDTWAKAATTFKTVSDLMGAGDITYCKNEAHTISIDTTFTFAGTVDSPCQVISTTDTANAPPTTIDAGFILDGSGTSGVDLLIAGKVLMKSCEIKAGGSTGTGRITLGSADESVVILDACNLTIPNTGSSSVIDFGIVGSTANATVKTYGCTFTFGNNSAQGFNAYCKWEDYGSTVAITTAVPTTLFKDGISDVTLHGTDISAISSTLIAGTFLRYSAFTFINCKLHASVAVLATQTGPAHAEAWLYDCSSGDNHYEFGHYNYYGNTTISTNIYMSGTDGASYNVANAKHSWKVTSVNGSYETPYISPWISRYNEATSAVTPRLEVLRDDPTSINPGAYKDDVVWGEFSVKTTTGFTTATINTSDRCAILTHNAGTASNQASSALGATGWDGETGTPWYGKLEPSATITPAEIGHIQARVCVAGANTIYVNPKILGV